jgi:hypothetical protein
VQNIRAIFLIEKSNLSEKDKIFLKTHLEMYEALNQDFFNDAHMYRERLDQANGLDSKYSSIKENVIILMENLYNRLLDVDKLADESGQLKRYIELLDGDLAYILREKEKQDEIAVRTKANRDSI